MDVLYGLGKGCDSWRRSTDTSLAPHPSPLNTMYSVVQSSYFHTNFEILPYKPYLTVVCVSILLVVAFCPKLSREIRVHAVGQWYFLEL